MKIGMTAIGIGKAARPATIRAVAENADRLGFATLWAPEHVVLFDSHESKYPYSDDGRFMAGSTIDLLDPFIGLTYAAAFSQRIRLATGICLVAEHNPLVLAKVIASLDRVSSGRLALGVGIGWSVEEFAALGIPFEKRAQRTCEYIEAMRKLWDEPKSSYKGEFVRFDGVRSFPKPPQGAKLPVIFGGESMPALRRVARMGNGWFGVKLNPEQAAAKIATLRSLMSEAGRDIADLEIIISPYENQVTAEDLRAYHELGVAEFVPFVRLPGDDTRIPEALEQVAREWIEPAAKLR
ncbi:MAG: LLM class F420-dependent oxidoreductase [Candidatus Binatus sp.]|uniref:LLM class F420-dependent oxidoreductase n=1 Tax=Candidatus Binatus sp. TaxID=2811406 RepID=UPI0027282AD2|nr:LLM class F420-dependent oxidoreductase [Candidatus Binatus sp.]MDO8432099.1 LLM class F420-dependent oxidoreductase [Candidatus Binatus sp.]